MKKALVTGCSGFIGSHLVQKLLDENYFVVGVDGMLSNYDIALKQRNMEKVGDQPNFIFYPTFLQENQWDLWLEDVEVIYHLAALPGVRSSWGKAFTEYVDHNLSVTQQLLEACMNYPQIKKIVVASSSSVYGTMRQEYTDEKAAIAPISPYGVTKAAMENLCQVYVSSYQLPVVILRYFTVYGPRQRPDMGFHRFIKQVLLNQEITVFGDGLQTRDFTYVSDIVQASRLAAEYGEPGDVYNIGGDREISIIDAISLIGELLHVHPKIVRLMEQPGDSKRTCADITQAVRRLGYRPRVSLEEGLAKQIEDLLPLYLRSSS